MERSPSSALRVGAWRVDPASSQISRGDEMVRLEIRAMRLLVCLADRASEVVSIDDLIDHVWSGVAVTPDSVYQAVASLRRQLGDDSRQPRYIETVPRLGYRMVAPVGPWPDSQPEPSGATSAGIANPGTRSAFSRVGVTTWVALALAIAIVFGLTLHARLSGNDHAATEVATAPPQKSIAVLPFLDLTQGMHNEEFADGMTEELIDKLSRIPGLNVPSATSSFYYKGKQMPVSAMAKALDVAYILDGSVRKSGNRVRIAARMVRAENSYVVWTETYDRPSDDLLQVQDEIAGEVARALKTSIASEPGRSN